jgi:hypothetical protein
LGYIVDENEVHVNPTKIQVIHNCPTLTTLIELRIFLGITNLYLWLVLGFSHITWALSHMTKGGGRETFVWGKEQQQASDDLSHHLRSSPVLSLLYLQQLLEIETSASDYVVGTFLTQHGHPVAYHSETLSDTIRK